VHGGRSHKKLGNPAHISISCVIVNFGKHTMKNNYTMCNCKKHTFELENKQMEVMEIRCLQFAFIQIHKHGI
jgi:hypothetical protein